LNEPLLAKVNRYDDPGASEPESKTLELDVAVWLTAPLFVQQTVVPGATVIVAGEKLKSTIETIVSPLWHVAVATAGEAVAPPPGSAATSNAAASAVRR
jgi:hypothetical protein